MSERKRYPKFASNTDKAKFLAAGFDCSTKGHWTNFSLLLYNTRKQTLKKSILAVLNELLKVTVESIVIFLYKLWLFAKQKQRNSGIKDL